MTVVSHSRYLTVIVLFAPKGFVCKMMISFAGLTVPPVEVVPSETAKLKVKTVELVTDNTVPLMLYVGFDVFCRENPWFWAKPWAAEHVTVTTPPDDEQLVTATGVDNGI